MAARARALIEGRAYVIPKDLKGIGADVLRHRVVPSYEAEAQSIAAAELIDRIFEQIEVP